MDEKNQSPKERTDAQGFKKCVDEKRSYKKQTNYHYRKFQVNITGKYIKINLFRHKQAPFPLSPQQQNRFHFSGGEEKEGFGEKKERGRLFKTRSFGRDEKEGADILE
jgi:hypothetical protein